MNVKNITLTGEEVRVEVLGQNCDVKNDSEETIFISNRPNIVEGADGVMPLHPHEAAKYFDVRGIVYLKGTGKVVLAGNNEYNGLVFRTAAAAGGVDTAAREEIAELREMVTIETGTITLTNTEKKPVQQFANNRCVSEIPTQRGVYCCAGNRIEQRKCGRNRDKRHSRKWLQNRVYG